jgi:hypothetical protein
MQAQENKALVQLMPFSIQGLGRDEAEILEALIQSYIVDLGDNSPYRAVANPPAGTINPDYIITGSISLVNDERVLKLELVNTQTGDVMQFTSNHKTASDLALKSRSLVQEALSGGNETAQSAEIPETIQANTIAGTWKGDQGIEMIRLQRNGSGMAVFSSGARMMLSYSINENTLNVTQTSPNVDRFYHPVPYNIAKELVNTAEPMSWEMKLYNKGTDLKGTKKATAVIYEGDTIKSFLFGATRDAEWTKIN